MADNDFGALAKRIMWGRSAGRCEGCGRAGVGLQAHHRCYRSRGGDGGAANGLLLCGFGNASGCHGLAHSARGQQFGWSVGSHAEPGQVEVKLARFGQVLLTDSGLVLAAVGQACWAHRPQAHFGVAGCRECLPVGRVLWEFEEEKGWG